MSDKRREIEELRTEIGKVDRDLVRLLDRRAKLSRKVGEVRGQDVPNMPLAERGAMIEIAQTSSGDMPQDALRQILGHVHAECVALELPVPIAFVGVEGSQGHAASRGRFGSGATYVSAENAQGAIDAVTQKRAQFAVVPFETRADGPVQATILALMSSELRIIACFETAENLDVLGKNGSLADVERIYTTPADHAACLKFLSEAAPNVQVLDVKTPREACQLARDDARGAALAPPSFGSELDLPVLQRSVRDGGDERVRYAIVGARPSSRTGTDLTALAISVADSPGALHEILKQFAERGINLTKIQSRPAPGEAWVYLFFIEVVGHVTDRNLVAALEEVKRLAKFYRVLGSYQTP
jgi:chorismate mutase/prephenate dehydratase